MSDYIASLIRTIVPAAIAIVASWAIRHGFEMDQAEVTTQVTAAVFAVYYAVVRWAETRWPAVGWLLGLAKTPTYSPPPPTD